MKFGYQRTIKLLWHSAYYDGPISGVCEIDTKKFWFDKIKGSEGEIWFKHIDEEFDGTDDSYEYDIIRFYKIYKLPDEVMNTVIINHELFRKYIGHHTDYENNKRELGCHPNFMSNWGKYQIEYQKLDVTTHIIDSNCVGWFDTNSRYNK